MRRERHAAYSLKALSDAVKVVCAPDPRGSHAEPVCLTTAEASTGGLLAATLTATLGSSAYFERGFNVYSNPAKVELLDVSEETLQRYGAVSAKCTEELALGALRHSYANVALAVSGVSGPAGGTPEKPVGLTYITLALKGAKAVERLARVRSPLLTRLAHHHAEQSSVLLYTGALHFLFTGKERALTGTYAVDSMPLTDVKQSTISAESADLEGTNLTAGTARRARDGSPVLKERGARERPQLTERHETLPDAVAVSPVVSPLPQSQSTPPRGVIPSCPALHRVEVLLPWPNPQDYPLHNEVYTLRARMQEAVVREALTALCACLKGEPLLDYVEYINKVNFQDNS